MQYVNEGCNESSEESSSVQRFFSHKKRSLKVLLCPKEFDNEVFFASLPKELKNRINSLNIEHTETFVSEKMKVSISFPKLDVLLTLLIADGLMTSEMRAVMIGALRRPSSPALGEIQHAYGQQAVISEDDILDNASNNAFGSLSLG